MLEQYFASVAYTTFEQVQRDLNPVQSYCQTTALNSNLLPLCKSYSGFMNIYPHQDNLLSLTALHTSVCLSYLQLCNSFHVAYISLF